MSTVTPQALLKAWKLEQVTVEMSIGHILQNLAAQQTTQASLQQTLLKLRTDVDRLLAHTQLPPNVQGKPKPSQPDEMPDSE